MLFMRRYNGEDGKDGLLVLQRTESGYFEVELFFFGSEIDSFILDRLEN